MENEEKTVDAEHLEKDGEGQEVVVEEEAEEKSEDYRAKLNATNRFLEKEGYKFDSGKWAKPKVEKPEAKPEVVTEKPKGLSTEDTYRLLKADVAPEHVSIVTDYAAFKGVSIADALGSSTVKALIAEDKEKMATAQATSTGTQRRGPTKPSDQVLVEKFKKGEIPDAGTPEAEQLFWALRGGKPK